MSCGGNIFNLECVKKALQPIFVNIEDQEGLQINCHLESLVALNQDQVLQLRVIQMVRTQIIQRAKECPGKYYREDVEKIRMSDWAVMRFFPDDLHEQPIDKITESIDTSLKWRKEYGIREIHLSSFPAEFFTIGLFEFGTNAKNGKPVIYIRGSKYKKISELTEQFERFGSCLYDTLDSTVRTGQQRFTAYLDLKGVSLENVDVPTFRHILELMFNYFPNILQEAFIVDVSWFLRPIVYLLLKVIPERFSKNVAIMSRKDLTLLDPAAVPREIGGSLVTHPLPIADGAISLQDFVTLNNISQSVVAKAKKVYNLSI